MQGNRFVMITLGDRIRHMRARKGWSQMDLGLHAEVSWRTIQNIEAGQTSCTLVIAARIAQAFGCSIDYLAGLKGEVYA